MLVTEDLLADLSIPHQRDVPLGPLTWFGIGGRARILAHPQSFEQLADLVRRCRREAAPIYVLGEGANLLVADEGVNGVVVVLDAEAFKRCEYRGHLVTVGAGYHLFKLINETVTHGLAGLEVLAGVPATVGGAIRMNAGGAFGDIGRVVKCITLMDSEGEVFTRDRSELVFGYRSTNIDARFILEATLELAPQDKEEVAASYKKIMMKKQATQPLAANSAGCTFKNPAPDPATNDPRPAGKIIDQAGLKGTRVGGAMVSHQHANFIECDKTCTATDVIHLIELVESVVLAKTGITLQREVVIWPGEH